MRAWIPDHGELVGTKCKNPSRRREIFGMLEQAAFDFQTRVYLL